MFYNSIMYVFNIVFGRMFKILRIVVSFFVLGSFKFGWRENIVISILGYCFCNIRGGGEVKGIGIE